MKHTKRALALLLALVLALGLAMPAMAEGEPEFTITADKKMVATGETITLTAINAPQLEAGQTIEYRWFFRYDPVHGALGGKAFGTTTDSFIQIQAPGRNIILPTLPNPFIQRFLLEYTCVVVISDVSGDVASYRSDIEVQGYYSLMDSIAVPYERLGYDVWFMFFDAQAFLAAIACPLGIFWSPWVALANAREAKRVNAIGLGPMM